jgi:hypothetical protein
VKHLKLTPTLSFKCHINKNHTLWCGKVTAAICVILLALQREQSADGTQSYVMWVVALRCWTCVCKSFVCFFFRERFQNTFHIPVWNNCILKGMIFEQCTFYQIANHNMSFGKQYSSLDIIIINFLNISSRLFLLMRTYRNIFIRLLCMSELCVLVESVHIHIVCTLINRVI